MQSVLSQKTRVNVDAPENLIQNGPAPLATVDIDTEIVDHTEETIHASNDATRNIGEAIIKIRAGARGFATRKQLKLQQSDSTGRLDCESLYDRSRAAILMLLSLYFLMKPRLLSRPQ